MSSLIESNVFSVRKFCLAATIVDYKFRKCLKCLPKSSGNEKALKNSPNINDWIGEDGRAEIYEGGVWMDEKSLIYQIGLNTCDRKYAFFDFLMLGVRRFHCEAGSIFPWDAQNYENDKTFKVKNFCSSSSDSDEEDRQGIIPAQDAQDYLDDHFTFDNETDLLLALQKNGKLVTFQKKSFGSQNILSSLAARQNGHLMRADDMITILDKLIPGVVDYEIGHGINLWDQN